jgi:hypothetical protein
MKALGTLVQYKTFKGKADIELIINVPAHTALATQNLLGQIDPAESKWVEISLFTPPEEPKIETETV